MTQAMKKLFSLFLFALLGATSFAQQGYATQESADNIHDRSGSQFAVNAPRIRANIAPNPLVDRSTLDASGAVIRGIIIRNADGREVRRETNVDAVRYSILRPGLFPGSHTVEVHTDFGATVVKLAVQ